MIKLYNQDLRSKQSSRSLISFSVREDVFIKLSGIFTPLLLEIFPPLITSV